MKKAVDGAERQLRGSLRRKTKAGPTPGNVRLKEAEEDIVARLFK
jgi:hypothetical protein